MLLKSTASYNRLKSPELMIKVVRENVIIYEPSETDTCEGEPSNTCCIFTETALSFFLIGVKIFASLGSRVYGVEKLLYEPNYIYSHDFFNRWPAFLSLGIVIWAGASDVFMNLVTRGSATRRLMKRLFGTSQNLEQSNDYFNTIPRKIGCYSILFCGLMSSITASLAAFLGSVTLLRFVTNDFKTLVAVGSVVAFANFMSNISYRLDKAINNFNLFLENKLEYSISNVFLSLVGLSATLGLYYFNTSESIRLILRMFDVYLGNPDSQVGVDDYYEDWINGLTDASLIPSIVSYFFSQCCEMMSQNQQIEENHFSLPIEEFKMRFNQIQRHESYYKNLHFYAKDNWSIKGLNLLAITTLTFFIFGEMFGNLLQTFNGDNGLIVHLFIRNNDNVFNQEEKIYIGLASTFLAFISSAIYWKFNIIDWRDKMKGYWVNAVIKTYEHAGLYNSNSMDGGYKDLIELVRLEVEDEEQYTRTTRASSCSFNIWNSIKKCFYWDKGLSSTSGRSEALYRAL